MKILLWILLLVVMAFMCHQSLLLRTSGYGMVSLQLAEQTKGNEILSKWNTIHYGDSTLLDVAGNNLQLDFFYLLVYVLWMMVLSNAQMQCENWMPLNELLRLNLFLAPIAGILDVIENFRLLHNLHHFNDPAQYWGTHYWAMAKFILCGWVLLILLLSVLHQMVFVRKI